VPATDHHALIVTKESELGAQSAMILQKQQYRCEVFQAGSASARDDVRNALSGKRFHLVIAQQRMSPYSASEVLHDVNAANGPVRPAVVCLAYDGSDRNTFIRDGGAGFILLEPGQKDLRDAIADALSQVQQHDQYQSSKKRRALEYIDRFVREDKFQHFIEEIFHELKYLGVRRTHGPTEKGKDIVCYEVNRMGRAEYVGVQIKLGDVHASGGRGSLTDLWRQSLEAFNSRVAFPEGTQYLDKFVVIASGRINELARDKLMDSLRSSHAHRRIIFLDREELADLLVSSCPALLASLE
jgi:DNA-binding NarL/FixJ family response regulator